MGNFKLFLPSHATINTIVFTTNFYSKLKNKNRYYSNLWLSDHLINKLKYYNRTLYQMSRLRRWHSILTGDSQELKKRGYRIDILSMINKTTITYKYCL